MPIGDTALRKQSHGKRRSIYHTYALLFEISQIVVELVIVQAEVAKVEYAFNRACRCAVNHPFEIFKLQVGYTT